MSRLFDDAQSEYLKRNEVVFATPPFAMVCWFNSNDNTNPQFLMSIQDKDANLHFHNLLLLSNNFKIQTNAGGDTFGAVASANWTTNTWHHACGIFASTSDRRALLDGANKGTDVTDLNPAGLDSVSIGIRYIAVPDWPMSGMIAEVAFYDLSGYPGATDALKADYFEANVLPGLAAHEKPSEYPTGLIAYWSFETSSLDDEKGEFDLTASGTTFDYDHPSVYRNLGGAISAQSTLTADTTSVEELIGSIAVQSALTGSLQWLKELAGSIAAQSSLTGNLRRLYIQIPPLMHKDLIDPYSGGAWMWLCRILIPGYAAILLARNTEDVTYDEKVYSKWNLEVGKQTFAGDGSISRLIVKVAQGPDKSLEKIVNATKGAHHGTFKLMRVHEDFLDYEIEALGANYGILVADSDWEWVYFTLGIPNPLTQKVPLRIGSSKICPWMLPELFKGPACQYTGSDTSCKGTIEDCRDNKNNAIHWGAELGLDPNVAKV